MSNSHFWLTPAEQAIMDAATTSAPDYGFIAATRASREHLEERLGIDLSPRDFIPVPDLTDVGDNYGAVGRFNLVRLSVAQKQVLESDCYGLEACHIDPTGEYWGNIMLDLVKMQAGEHDHLCNPHSNAKMAVSFIANGTWGSTLASIRQMQAAQGSVPVSVPFIDPTAAEPQLSDWPDGYVALLNEREFDGEASDEALLAELTSSHEDMRFGQFIDLDIQQGFYLHPGNGVVAKAQGSESGFVIGGLAQPSINVDSTGAVEWWAIEGEEQYVTDGFDRLEWAMKHADGPWMLTADYHEGKWDQWYWLVLRFLSYGDEAAYMAAFRKGGK